MNKENKKFYDYKALKKESMKKKLNGFNNGRDTTDGVGGKPVYHEEEPSPKDQLIQRHLKAITSCCTQMSTAEDAELAQSCAQISIDYAEEMYNEVKEEILALRKTKDEAHLEIMKLQSKLSEYEKGYKLLFDKMLTWVEDGFTKGLFIHQLNVLQSNKEKK